MRRKTKSNKFKEFLRNRERLIFLIIVPLGLLLFNLFLIYPIFQGNYSSYMASIEVAFYTDAKFVYDHFPHLGWNPQWYLGFPFNNAYPPLIPFFIALIHGIFGLNWAHIYRIIMGLFYLISPVTFYFFLRYLTKRFLPAFIGSFTYLLLPSFIYFLSSPRGMASGLFYAPWQVIILTIYGEGPHVVSLGIGFLAALFFLKYLDQPKYKYFILTIIFLALTAFINWFGLVALLIALFVIFLAQLSQGGIKDKIKRTFWVLVAGYGLIAFWFNKTYILSSLSFGQGGRGEGNILSNYLKIIPLFPILIPIIITIIIASSKRRKSLALIVGILWTFIYGVVILAWYYGGNLAFLPQPPRFLTEFNLGIIILFTLLINYLYEKIRKKTKAVFSLIFIIVLVGFSIFSSLEFLKNSHQFFTPRQDIKDTYEYQINSELEKLLVDKEKGERVLMSGNAAFWLDYIGGVAQVKGAGDQAATHPWWGHALYQVVTGENAPFGKEEKLAYDWLRALNVSYLVVHLPGSRDPFLDFRNLERFDKLKKEGVLEEVYNQNYDVIYKVSLNQPSLAQVVDSHKFDSLVTPVDGADYKSVKKYADWIDSKIDSQAEFRWINNDEFEIEAEVEEGNFISTQITYDKGWQIKDGKEKLETNKDVIGNMVIFPQNFGKIKIKGEYKKTWDVWLGYLITLVTIIILTITFLKKKNKGYEKINRDQKKKRREEQ